MIYIITHCCLFCKLWIFLSKQPGMNRINMSLHGNNPINLIILNQTLLQNKTLGQPFIWLDGKGTIDATFFDMHTIHHNICKFSRSTCKSSFTTKRPQQMEFWWCDFQNTPWISITTSYNTSFSNKIVVFKCTFFISGNEVLGMTSSHKYGSSTPPTLSTMV